MQKLKDHTFVIPAHQNSVYLETCIQSLFAQSVASNIIITTSTPNEFVEQLAIKYELEYHVNTGIKGIAADWNFALSKSSTALVTLAHQDDIYEPNYTAEIKKAFAQQNNIQIAFTSYKDIINGKIRPIGLNSLVKHLLLSPFLLSKYINNKALKRAILIFGDPICCPSVTFNKTTLGSEFKFDHEYQCALDWLAWYQLAHQTGTFVYINRKLMQHRIHSDSETTNQLNNGRRKKEEQQIFQMIWGKSLAKIINKFYTIGHKENL